MEEHHRKTVASFGAALTVKKGSCPFVRAPPQSYQQLNNVYDFK